MRGGAAGRRGRKGDMYDVIVWLIVGVGLAGSAVADSGDAPGLEWRSDAMGDLGYLAMWAGLF
jgi:hypothetical protein